MTNDEAINTLKNTAFLGWSEQAEKVEEAVRMAVEALKTQLPKEDTTSDCISRQEAIRIASGYCHFTNVAKELEKLPSVRPVDKDINVSCKDAISRQAAIDALEKVADLFPWRVPGKSDTYDRYNEAWNDAIGRAEMEIEKLPSVQPDIIACGDCKHWICHDRRCGYWNHGVKPLEWCCHAERRTDG